MSGTDMKRIEKVIRERVEAALESGVFLNDGEGFGVDASGTPYTCGACLVGALVLGKKSQDFFSLRDTAASVLRVSVEDIRELEAGYAHWTRSKAPLAALGRRIRRDYGPAIEAAK